MSKWSMLDSGTKRTTRWAFWSCAETPGWSDCAKTVGTTAATASRVVWVCQRQQIPLEVHAEALPARPSWHLAKRQLLVLRAQSEITRRMPRRPRRTILRRNAVRKAPPSEAPASTPSTCRSPSAPPELPPRSAD